MDIFAGKQDITYLVYCGIAVGTLLAFTGMAQLASRREKTNEAKTRRLRMLAKGHDTADVLALLKPKQSSGFWRKMPFVGDLPRQLHQSGLTIGTDKFTALCLLLGFGVFAFALYPLGPVLAFVLSILVGFIGPVGFVKIKYKQRTDELTKQLPDALDMLARGLKVGHPLSNSIGAIAREMPDPIGTEFGIVFDQISYGDDLPDAFQEFAQRVDIEDVYYLAASIGIQHGTGGDLVNVIEILSRVIRDRIAMRRKIRAISSEGRLTAWFLSALPVIIGIFTSITAPNYYRGVMEDPLFVPMAIAVVVLTFANLLVLKKLVNFRI